MVSLDRSLSRSLGRGCALGHLPVLWLPLSPGEILLSLWNKADPEREMVKTWCLVELTG